jgi:hypothetical protein
VRASLSSTGAMALVSFALAAPCSASPLDMEGVAPGAYQGSLVVADGPLTLTVTPLNKSSGYVLAREPNVPLLGNVALIGSETDTPIGNEFIALKFDFKQAINSITFNFGDAGGDDDGTVEIRAYSAGDMGDTLLGSVEDVYPADAVDGKALTLNFPGATYFVARSFGGQDDNSLYWDIGGITPAAGSPGGGPGGAVPEPPTWALMLAAFLGVGWASRRALHNRTPRAPAAC